MQLYPRDQGQPSPPVFWPSWEFNWGAFEKRYWPFKKSVGQDSSKINSLQGAFLIFPFLRTNQWPFNEGPKEGKLNGGQNTRYQPLICSHCITFKMLGFLKTGNHMCVSHFAPVDCQSIGYLSVSQSVSQPCLKSSIFLSDSPHRLKFFKTHEDDM